MAKKSSDLIGGLAIAAVMIAALPVAQGIAASTNEAPVFQVNHAAKGDRLAEPNAVETGSIAVKKARCRRRCANCVPFASRPTSARSWTAASRCSAR